MISTVVIGIRSVVVAIRTVVRTADCREKGGQMPVRCTGGFVYAPRTHCAVHYPCPVSFTRFSRSSAFPVCQKKGENERQMILFTDGLPGSFGEVSPEVLFKQQKDNPVSSGFWAKRAKIGRKNG